MAHSAEYQAALIAGRRLSTPGQVPGTGEAENGSLVQKAMRAVTDHIRTHALRVGDALPSEAYFAAELSVSRPVVREAFGALAALRLIDVGNGRRARIAAIDGSVIASSLYHAVTTAQITVPEAWEVRRTIELRTATLAAMWRTPQQAAQITKLADAMKLDVADAESVMRHDIAFHTAVARASRNAMFVQIVASFAPLMQVAIPNALAALPADHQRLTLVERHRELADAIRRQDRAAAAASMSLHFDAAPADWLKATSAWITAPSDSTAAPSDKNARQNTG